MEDLARRPFYDEYAWAYDLIITPRLATQGDFMVEMLGRRGVGDGARLTDDGCGAGRYSVELARRGYVVRGIDLSPKLISEAPLRFTDEAIPVSFAVGNILALAATLPV